MKSNAELRRKTEVLSYIITTAVAMAIDELRKDELSKQNPAEVIECPCVRSVQEN